MSFVQNFYGSIGNVINVEGTVQVDGRVVLGKESGSDELIQQLLLVRKQLAATPGVDDASRQNATAKIDAAVQEARSTKPKGNTIKTHLDEAADTLKSATSTASNVLGLAKTLFAFGTWAASLLG